MKQIKNILFLSVFLFIPIAGIDVFDKNKTENISTDKAKKKPEAKKNISLPFNLEISLDVIGLELAHYKDQFKKDWNTSQDIQVIIEEAEILVQTAQTEFQTELKSKITNLFKKYNALIAFTADNKIIPQIKIVPKKIKNTDDTDTDSDTEILNKRKEEKLKLPKKHKKKKTQAKQIVAPKRIHGARRTMKRLKKEAEERRIKEIEAIKARIEAKKDAVLKEKRKNFLEQEARIRENMIREHAKEREKIVHEIQANRYKDLHEENPIIS